MKNITEISLCIVCYGIGKTISDTFIGGWLTCLVFAALLSFLRYYENRR